MILVWEFNGDGYGGNEVWRELLGLEKREGESEWKDNVLKGDCRDEVGCVGYG